jgi:hypothetical protein
MTSDRQRLQPFHDVEPGASSPYNLTAQIYSEGIWVTIIFHSHRQHHTSLII